tara:strand:+ start:783 stop:1571 length:789 start_codon:yes stop_codon:yes gene_type:complete
MLTSTETIKNSKSRLLRLSSEDKVLGDNGRFKIDLISNGGAIDNVAGYVVHSIQCPNVFDNVPAYANVLTLVKATGAVSYDVVIPQSYYYIDDLITTLTTAINTATPDTVAIIKTGFAPVQKLSFTFTGDSYDLKVSSTVASRLGLTADLTCPDGVATVLQSIPNLAGETEIYIHSRTLAPNNLMEGSGSFSVVDKLPLDQQYGAMCYSNLDNDDTHYKKYFPYESLKTIRTVSLTVRNRTGQILTLPSNYNLSMMLMIYYK